jgi:large repetitive protein
MLSNWWRSSWFHGVSTVTVAGHAEASTADRGSPGTALASDLTSPSRHTGRRGGPRGAARWLERLEDRRVMSVTAAISPGGDVVLSVTGANEVVSLSVDALGQLIADSSDAGDVSDIVPIPLASIQSLSVVGDIGTQTVRFDGVVPLTVPILSVADSVEDVTIAAPIASTAGDLTIITSGSLSIDLGGSASATGGNLLLQSDGAILASPGTLLTTLTAGQTLSVSAGADLVIDQITAAGDVSLQALNALTMTGSVSTTGGLTATAESIAVNASIDADAGAELTATVGDIQVQASITSSQGDITVSAADDVLISADLTTAQAGRNINLTADTDATGGGGVRVFSTAQLSSAGGVTLTGSDLSQTVGIVDGVRLDGGGPLPRVSATGNILLQTQLAAPANADVVVDGAVFSQLGDITAVAAQSIVASGVLQAEAGSVSLLSTLIVAGPLQLLAGTDVLVEQVLDDGESLTDSSLTVTAAGLVRFGGSVDQLTKLAVTGNNGIELCGGSYTTVESQQYTGPVVLCADTTISTTGPLGTVTFDGTINSDALATPRALQVNSANTTEFRGAVGNIAALRSLQTDATGTTVLNASSVVTTGAQQYFDAVQLLTDATLTSLSGGTLEFADTVDGPAGLTIDTAGETVFSGNVGSSTPLAALTTDAVGQTRIDAAVVSSSGAMNLRDALQLTNSTTITGASIVFGSTVDAAPLASDVELTLNITDPVDPLGDITFQAAVGSMQPFENLTITTANDVLFADALTLQGTLTQTAGEGTTRFEGVVSLPSLTAGHSIATREIAFAPGTASWLSSAASVTFTADAMTLPTTSLQLVGTITLQTLSSTVGIGIEDAAQGLSLTNAELAVIDADQIVIGSSTQTAGISVGVDGAVLVDDHLLLLTGGSINVTGSLGVTTTNSLELQAAQDVLIAALVRSEQGPLTVDAGRDVRLNATGRVETASGTLLLTAGQDLQLADGSRVASDVGAVTLVAVRDVVLSQVVTGNSTTSAMQVTSVTGRILDGGDTGGADLILTSPTAVVTLSAVQGIGTALSGGANAPLETQVTQLRAVNTTSGDVALNEVDSLTVLGITQQGPGDVLITSGGTMTVAATGTGIAATSGAIALVTTGPNSDLLVNAAVQTTGGHISATTSGAFLQQPTGPIRSFGGNVSVSAATTFTQVNGAVIDSGAGRLSVIAANDVTLSQLISQNDTAFAMSVTSLNGGIRDGGDAAGVNLLANAPNAVVTLSAATGVGAVSAGGADAAIETQIARVIVQNSTSGAIHLQEVDAIDILQIQQPGSGAVTVSSGGPLTVVAEQPGITASNGPILLSTTGPIVPITIAGLVRSTSGAITLQATGDVRLTSTGQVASASGAVRVEADRDVNGSGGIVMADGSTIDAGGGAVTLMAAQNVAISDVRTTSIVSVTSRLGGLVDVDANTGIDISAAAFSFRTATGVGSGNPLEISVQTLAGNNSTGGAVQLVNVSGNPVTIGSVDGVTGLIQSAAAPLQLINNDGITVSAAISSLAGGTLSLTANGLVNSSADIIINAPLLVSGGSGDILLTAGNDLLINNTAAAADVRITGSGDVRGVAGGNVVFAEGVLVQTPTGAAANLPPQLLNVQTPQITAEGQAFVFATIQRPSEYGSVVTVDWGDGTVDTFVYPPGSGTGTLEVSYTHFYTSPPDPLNPAAPIPITITVTNDATLFFADQRGTLNDTSVLSFAPVPGEGLASFPFDLTPPVQPLAFPEPLRIDAALLAASAPPADGTLAELLTTRLEGQLTSERQLILEVFGPDGVLTSRAVLPEETLDDLDRVVRRLPDGRYRFLLQEPGETRPRLLQEFEVREGRIASELDNARPRSRPAVPAAP